MNSKPELAGKPKKFKKGDKVRLLVHGAGVTSEEVATIARVTKTAVYDEDRGYNAQTGRNLENGVFGFWFEIKPMLPSCPVCRVPMFDNTAFYGCKKCKKFWRPIMLTTPTQWEEVSQ